jgi:hypothetical protein
MTKRAEFYVTAACPDWRKPKEARYKLVSYPMGRADFPTESTVYWNTKEDAEAACARVNAGDETGVTFASYADD